MSAWKKMYGIKHEFGIMNRIRFSNNWSSCHMYYLCFGYICNCQPLQCTFVCVCVCNPLFTSGLRILFSNLPVCLWTGTVISCTVISCHHIYWQRGISDCCDLYNTDNTWSIVAKNMSVDRVIWMSLVYFLFW